MTPNVNHDGALTFLCKSIVVFAALGKERRKTEGEDDDDDDDGDWERGDGEGVMRGAYRFSVFPCREWTEQD